ncbi:MAG: SPOR domain-containing protein, partial [Desulfobulbaceae bacterium]|nr:SPOR domain-containing protein [Desulfobulbaceae bacterium]
AVPAPPALDKPAVARDVDGGQAAKVEVEVPVVPPATPAAVAPVVVEEVLTEQPAVPAQPALDKPAVAYEVDGGQAATVDVEVPVVPPATPAAVAPVVVEEVLTERPAAPAPPALDKPAVAYEVDGGQAATAGAAQAVEKKVEGAGAVAVGTAATGSLVVDNKGNQPRGKYTLHAGTVEHRQEATAKVARLRQSGFPAFAYAIAGKSGALVYRVVAGRYDVMVEAKAASRRLAELGVGSFIANTR